MPVSHFVNCLLLTLGPYYALYNMKSTNSLFFIIVFSAIFYILTAAFKIFLLANFQIPENIIDILDVIGIYFLLKTKYISQEANISKIIGASIGWSLMAQICNRLFINIMDSLGDQVGWDNIKSCFEGHIQLFETIAFVALMTQKRENQALTIFIVIFKFLILPFLYQLLENENQNEILASKTILAVSLLFICKIKKFI